MAAGTFGTAINCMDGRAQAPVADWIKGQFQVDYVDMVTYPGADGLLAGASGASPRIEHLREYTAISVEQHGSRIIAVAGHHGCAGYPVSRELHIAAIQQAAQRVQRTWGFAARVVGLWITDQWQVERVYDSEAV
jgi:hypothetical protein